MRHCIERDVSHVATLVLAVGRLTWLLRPDPVPHQANQGRRHAPLPRSVVCRLLSSRVQGSEKCSVSARLALLDEDSCRCQSGARASLIGATLRCETRLQPRWCPSSGMQVSPGWCGPRSTNIDRFSISPSNVACWGRKTSTRSCAALRLNRQARSLRGRRSAIQGGGFGLRTFCWDASAFAVGLCFCGGESDQRLERSAVGVVIARCQRATSHFQITQFYPTFVLKGR